MKTLALFDFDGTITKKDTLLEFAKFHSGIFRFLAKMALLAPALSLMKLKIIPNWKGKELFLTTFFGGMDEKDFDEACREFAHTKIPKLIREGALDEIRRQQENGEALIVSASPENWIQPWADTVGMRVLGTKLESENAKLTGKIAGKNCYGPEKVARIKESTDLDKYKKVIAFGDSAGDHAMFAIADDTHYKPFR